MKKISWGVHKSIPYQFFKNINNDKLIDVILLSHKKNEYISLPHTYTFILYTTNQFFMSPLRFFSQL